MENDRKVTDLMVFTQHTISHFMSTKGFHQHFIPTVSVAPHTMEFRYRQPSVPTHEMQILLKYNYDNPSEPNRCSSVSILPEAISLHGPNRTGFSANIVSSECSETSTSNLIRAIIERPVDIFLGLSNPFVKLVRNQKFLHKLLTMLNPKDVWGLEATNTHLERILYTREVDMIFWKRAYEREYGNAGIDNQTTYRQSYLEQKRRERNLPVIVVRPRPRLNQRDIWHVPYVPFEPLPPPRNPPFGIPPPFNPDPDRGPPPFNPIGPDPPIFPPQDRPTYPGEPRADPLVDVIYDPERDGFIRPADPGVGGSGRQQHPDIHPVNQVLPDDVLQPMFRPSDQREQRGPFRQLPGNRQPPGPGYGGPSGFI